MRARVRARQPLLNNVDLDDKNQKENFSEKLVKKISEDIADGKN